MRVRDPHIHEHNRNRRMSRHLLRAELMHHMRRHHRHHHEFHWYRRYLRWLRPLVPFLNLILIVMLWMWMDNKWLAVICSLLILAKDGIYLHFIRRFVKRIFEPVTELHRGVQQIARGNYKVRVECDRRHEMGVLIQSFNDMAEKLSEGERLQAEYEDNRKALIANISHDLKTPITAIEGYVEAILEGSLPSPDKTESYLRTILHNTVYINKLVDDLFLFAKLDMKKLELQLERTSVPLFMRDLMEEFRFELEEKGCVFHYEDETSAEGEELYAQLDGKRIHQAVRNVIGNAVKHGPKQGLAISAKLSCGAGYAALSIEDNGPGIPADKLPHIFDRFYRVDPERSKDLTSTGLGLAIAKELVEAHGGSITVASTPGAGACFTVKLPLATEEGGR